MDESENYDVFAEEAHRIIDQLVNQSLAHVNDSEEISNQENEENAIERGRFIESENEAKSKDYTTVQWPSIAEFTDENIGLEKINEYIEKVN